MWTESVRVCCKNRVSRSTFETWRRRGIGAAKLQPIPGGRIIISQEAEDAWRRAGAGMARVRKGQLMLILRAMLLVMSIITVAHADDWQRRAKEAVSGTPNLRISPACCTSAKPTTSCTCGCRSASYDNGDVYLESYDSDLTFNGIKAGATHPAIPCNETIEGVERVDPTTFLVRVYCKGATLEPEAVSVQLIGDTITIRNTEAF
jgi:hypothetical protein